MYLVAIAWMYVVVMMAIAEATHSGGSLLGACITLVLYGLMPLSIVLYIMDAPRRRRAAREREQHGSGKTPAISPEPSALTPDARSHASTSTDARGVPPV